MFTPSGRFQVNTRLCLSISDYHPDTWNPSWTVSTIIMGLISFMNENSHTLGALTTSDSEKRVYARRSREYNLQNGQFCEIFPELAKTIKEELASERALAASSTEENTNTRPNESTSSSFTATVLMVVGFAVLVFAIYKVVQNAAL